MGQVNHKLFYFYYCECWLLLFIVKQDLIKKIHIHLNLELICKTLSLLGEWKWIFIGTMKMVKQNSYLKSSIFKELIIFTQVPTKYSWKSTFNDFG